MREWHYSDQPKFFKIVQAVLLALIVIGLVLLATQKVWVPKLVDKIIESQDFETYMDPGQRFSFEYPGEFVITNDGEGHVLLTIPDSFQPGTNFSEARFSIRASNDPNEVARCSTRTATSSDAAAGNRYDTTSHFSLLDGDCYVLEYTIHSTNLGNYDPSQGIQEFDKVLVQNVLENIVKSFRFLVNSD